MAEKTIKTEFFSTYGINQRVIFSPMALHNKMWAVATDNEGYGTIIAIRFTESKVFYDIVDEYFGRLFEGVDSCLVHSDEVVVK